MLTKRFGFSVLAVSVALVGLGVIARSAGGGFIDFKDGDKQNWRASWADSLDNVLSLKGPTNGGAGIGILTKAATFEKGVTSMVITFTQMSSTGADDFGLRFTLNESITNKTGMNWTDFSETLKEVNPDIVSPMDMKNFPPGNKHPWFAHFHNNASDKFNSGTQFKLSGNFPESQGADPKNIVPLLFTGSLKGDGSDSPWTPTGIGIHERTFGDAFKGGKGRVFELIETFSVPEPSTFILVGLSLATLGCAYRRSKAAAA
jgi:hypothetical protein